jgi:hypothetical protein
MHLTARMTDTTTRRTARDLGPDDLIWDHFSRPRTDDVVARVHAAAAAGYAAIGLYLGMWATLREQPAELERVDDALAATGLVVANIETLRGWAVPGADEACRARSSTLLLCPPPPPSPAASVSASASSSSLGRTHLL